MINAMRDILEVFVKDVIYTIIDRMDHLLNHLSINAGLAKSKYFLLIFIFKY